MQTPKPRKQTFQGWQPSVLVKRVFQLVRILQEWQGETANFQRKFEEGEGTAGFAQGEQNEEQNNATGMMQLPASNLLPSLRLILRSNVQIMCTASHYTKRQHQRSASSSSARRAPHRFNKDRHKTAAGMQAIPSRIAEPKTHRPTGSHLLITSQEPFANISKYGNQLFTNMEVGKASYNCTSLSETV